MRCSLITEAISLRHKNVSKIYSYTNTLFSFKITKPKDFTTKSNANKMNLNSPKTSHMASVKIDKGYQTVSMFNVFLLKIWKNSLKGVSCQINLQKLLQISVCICIKKIKNICPWLVNWNVQCSDRLWNVSGGYIAIFGNVYR